MTNPTWQKAIEEFSRTIKRKLASNIKDVRLFGSVARGNGTPESDIDILVLVEKEDKLTDDTIMDSAVDVNLNYDVVISPIIMTVSHYTNQLFKETAFYYALEQEGVSI
ncbi:nucleotidyltransferase domain-containing protein [Paradesulfitobacterium aromaticivorans]